MIKELCEEFMEQVGDKCSVYNEVSLQFELGKYLQEKMGNEYCVQYERNIVKAFGLQNWKKKPFKSEADIIVFRKPKDYPTEPLTKLMDEENLICSGNTERYLIELKFPRNGAYPYRMWQFLEDIAFCDQLFTKVVVKETVCIAMADKSNKSFYEGTESDEPYCFFRKGKIIPAAIVPVKQKKDGKYYLKHQELFFKQQYSLIEWKEGVNGNFRYYLVSNG